VYSSSFTISSSSSAALPVPLLGTTPLASHKEKKQKSESRGEKNPLAALSIGTCSETRPLSLLLSLNRKRKWEVHPLLRRLEKGKNQVLPKSRPCLSLSIGLQCYRSMFAHPLLPMPSSDSRFKRFLRTLSMFFAPINLVICASLCIALVQPLKALFVDVSAEGGPSWKGPDGKPPLGFLIDTGSSTSGHGRRGQLIPFQIAAFLGAITIPLSLVLLGASFARMKIPRPISRLPIPAILSVCVAKLVLLPIVGVLIVQAMVKGGLIPPQNKAQIFVAMYLSGTPTSITYEPDSTAGPHKCLTAR